MEGGDRGLEMPRSPVCPEPLAVRAVGGGVGREPLCAPLETRTPTQAPRGGVSEGTRVGARRPWDCAGRYGEGEVQAWKDIGEDRGG